MGLSDYLNSTLGSLASYLDWSVSGGSYAPIVNDVLELYGVATEAEATNLQKLHAIAKAELWKKVMTEVSADYSFSADGGSYNRNQVYEMAKGNFEIALADALFYLPNYQIETGELTTEQDPYSYDPPYYLRDK